MIHIEIAIKKNLLKGKINTVLRKYLEKKIGTVKKKSFL